MNTEYPILIRTLHFMSSKSVISMIVMMVILSLLLPDEFFNWSFAAVTLIGIYSVFSGNFLYETNQKYVKWLAKKRTETIIDDPSREVIEIFHQIDISNISPIRTRINPTWYSPNQLKDLVEELLEYPPEVTFHLVNIVLPLMNASQLGIRTNTSEFAGDLMMTFERMFALNSDKAIQSANYLAFCLMALPNLKRARETLLQIGQIEADSALLRDEGAVLDHIMRKSVLQTLIKIDQNMARSISKGLVL